MRFAQTHPAASRLAISRTRRVVGLFIMVIVLWALYEVQTRRFQSYEVLSASMEPTLKIGDRLWMWRESTYARGDIVVIHNLGSAVFDVVKRIVALDPDSVRVRRGVVYVNGTEIDAPTKGTERSREFKDGFWTLEKGQCFVVGDNRLASVDSRDYGPVPLTAILGKVVYRIGPAERRGPVK